MASDPITSWQIDGKTMETGRDFYFLGSKITADADCSHNIKRLLLLERKAMTKLDSILKSRDRTRWWRSRWTWSTSLSTDTSGTHLQTQKCMQNTSWKQTGVPDQWKRIYQFSSVQSLSRVRLFSTPWITACQASLSITNFRSLLKLMPIESVMPSNHFILCRPLLLLPSIPLSIRVFSNESALCMRWPKYWSFSFSISPSNEHPGLISFRMDWLDLLAVQGTLKSLLQHDSSKASIFQRSAFLTVQLSHPYMTTGKTIELCKTR